MFDLFSAPHTAGIVKLGSQEYTDGAQLTLVGGSVGGNGGRADKRKSGSSASVLRCKAWDAS
jgi:hypothetical protein